MSNDSPVNAPVDLFIGSIARLAGLFYGSLTELGSFEPVAAHELSTAGRTLLAHNNHMTVTLEAYHNSLVDVHVLEEWHDESSYARKIVLTRQSDGSVVQFGIMRIWLADLPEDARDEIREKSVPLGRILMRRNVLRQVQLVHLWQIAPGPDLCRSLKITPQNVAYGRTAEILVDHRPTVQLLEIVADQVER